MRTRLAPTALMAVLVLLAAACGGSGAAVATQTATQAAPTRAATAAPGTPAAEIQMCNLVTGADVSGASPFTIPFVAVKPQSSQPGSCVYQFEKDGEYASIRIDLVAFDSHETAVSSLQAHSEAIQSAYGIAREAVPGLGDQAAWSAGTEDAGIDVVTGSRLITVNVGSQGGKAPDGARRAAAITLAKLVLDRIR